MQMNVLSTTTMQASAAVHIYRVGQKVCLLIIEITLSINTT